MLKKIDSKKNKYDVRFTERDMKVIEFLFRVRFASLEQLCKYTNSPSRQALYLRLMKLKSSGYIASKKLRLDAPVVFYPGVKAEGFLPVSPPSITRIIHNLSEVDVFLKLLDLGIKEDKIQTDLELLLESKANIVVGQSSDKKPNHVPDLVVTKSIDDKERKIAYEIELTKKLNKDFKKVIDYYNRERSYYEVVYLYSKDIKQYMHERMKEYESIKFVKFIPLEEFVKDTNSIKKNQEVTLTEEQRKQLEKLKTAKNLMLDE